LSNTQALDCFLDTHRLPDEFRESAELWFRPLCNELAAHQEAENRPLLIGINGSQGSGKSTLAALLTQLLREDHKKHCLALSIDDFYLTHKQRQHLAETVHPLLATRGVPGTHDTELLKKTLKQLIKNTGTVAIPRFDKSTDDRVPESQGETADLPLDIIILEGWCVGSRPEPTEKLEEAINPLEEHRDKSGKWRNFVNQTLDQRYRSIFQSLDSLIMLKAPSFDCVFQWRQEQETKLAERLGVEADKSQLMNPEELHQFIQGYERITRHTLKTMPQFADTVFFLDEHRRIVRRQN
jgi:D-glycerate 3-kinase